MATATESVPRGLQKTFIVAVVGVFVAELAMTGYFMVQQSVTNPNLSSFTSVLITQLMPLALFGLAFALNPRKISRLGKLFESLVITITALSAFAVLMQLVLYAGGAGLMAGDNFAIYSYASAAVMVISLGVVLWYLARTKRWK